ncbi:RDD family protein [Alkalihalobacillus sp. MEB130]|uniref:RDD family protein n=1 Tax=Alkalihalobacillus sp. MEB130 TaxID=2976704 RepID=UPI0028DD8527|nr:RDD family protein [Alkalihalobacillus sp. MEB130]MDT8858605.1 RDD family protein [Alkalihalobacillus sp. MEB130]
MVERPAGFWVRVGASILDVIVVSGTIFILAALFGIGGDTREILDAVGNLVYTLLLPVLWFGYTVGKRLLGIRIVKMDGSDVGFGTMLLRVVVAGFVYAITLMIAYIVSVFMVAFRKDKRSIHDMIAKTYVTYNKPDEVNPYQES